MSPPTRRSPIALLFGLDAPVDRKTYLVVGLVLMAFKYALDATLIKVFTGVFWTPIQYLSPALSTREAFSAHAEWLVLVLGVLTLPFLWIGLSMSVRRAADAGRSPALGLLFLFPVLNYVAMLYLASLPTAPDAQRDRPAMDPDAELSAALRGTAIGATIGVAMSAFAGLVLGAYGAALFFVTPVMMGAAAGWDYNRSRQRPVGRTLAVAALTVVIAGGAMLLFAIEGVVCLTMASPIALVAAFIGALVGRFVADNGGTGRPIQATMVFLALPLLAGFEAAAPQDEPVREVRSHIIIDAPPEAIWPHVIGFAELPPPSEFVFRAGIAYPMRARIEGEGIGAIRHCEFSTGAFVEPITRWEPPHRLSFDVISQPVPMHETSPYRHLHPPHLDGYFRSKRGEFRLIPLPDGRTRLEGSTWYALDLGPVAYWTLWSDALVHTIHDRVLQHIATRVGG